MPKCKECDWFDYDQSFFYEREGELFCSLHKDEEESNA